MLRRFGATPGEEDGATGFASQPGVGPCPFIGKIETIAGTCSLIRAGRIIVEIKVGDPVCRGDVIKTAADGRVGIRFIDGTAFSLSNNARMMLREFACGGICLRLYSTSPGGLSLSLLAKWRKPANSRLTHLWQAFGAAPGPAALARLRFPP